ncbi:glycosyltransferase [Geobacter sp. DSM 9736]|uniref:glycosyltransferase n=1 Tax=Geobacter sp. DSM 9736 TaxID=1277350 RepID=UPI000B5023B8|nr:glycosyltransferase [Geobacter sp. DSM 9736]SNB46133.1 Glycosyltransferase involved in cell wall bisynthesis [Geobacter sp. DSM 9736]
MTSRRLRILYVDESNAVGGAEKYLKMVLGYFSRFHDTYLSHPDDDAHSRFYAELPTAFIPCRPEHYRRPAALFRHYLKIFRTLRPDMIHANLPDPSSCRTALAAAFCAGTPAVTVTNHLPNLTYPRSWRGKLVGKSMWDWFVWRIVFGIVDTSIVVSKASARSLESNYPAEKDKICCIYNGVDIARFNFGDTGQARRVRSDFGVADDAVLFCSIGRLEQQKGYEYLLSAMQQLVARHPHVKLLLIGDGTLLRELKTLALQLGIEGQVIFAGARSDIPELLSASDIYVNSSLFEGLPFSILEAMAAGLPIIATGVDGNREIVVDGETGVLVRPRDPDNLAQEMRNLVEAPERRAAIGRNARELVVRQYSQESMFRETENLYRRLTEPRGADAASGLRPVKE